MLVKISFFTILIISLRAQSNAADLQAQYSFNDLRTKQLNNPNLLYRLTTDIEPVHYRLELQPFFENSTFNGSVDITFRSYTEKNTIKLNTKDLIFYSSTFGYRLRHYPNTPGNITTFYENINEEFMVLTTSSNLEKNEEYILTLNFSAQIRNDTMGLFRAPYRADGGAQRFAILSNAMPNNARRIFPCFDEPSLKATFEIIIIRKNNMLTLSNTDVIFREIREHGWIADYFARTPPMSTKNIGMAILDFRYRELPAPRSGVLLRLWSLDSILAKVNIPLFMAARLTHFYESYFAMPCPLKKIDIIAVPDFNVTSIGAWGIFIFKSDILTGENAITQPRDEIMNAVTLAKPICQMWVSDLVSERWWDDSWINEGFCTCMSYKAIGVLRPTWQMNYALIEDIIQPALNLDSSRAAHALSIKLRNNNEIRNFYDEQLIKKATVVIKMLESLIGEDNFRRGMRTYLKKWQYKSAGKTDFWETMLQVTGDPEINSTFFLDTWTMQQGYPIINLTRDYTRGVTEVNQTYFVFSSEFTLTYSTQTLYDMIDLGSNTWDIPVTFASLSEVPREEYRMIWLHNDNITLNEYIAPENQWLIGNIDSNGLYRVSYDALNWQLLLLQFNENHKIINPISRSQIIDDVFELASGSYLNFTLALDFTLYMKKENDYLPWTTLLKHLQRHLFLLEGTCAHQLFLRYVAQQIHPMYKALDWKQLPSETPLMKHLRIEVIKEACYLGLKDCTTLAKELFKAWMVNPVELRVDPHVYEIVICNGIRYGGDDEWHFVFNLYQENMFVYNPLERKILRNGLTCSRNPVLIQRLLSLTLTDIMPNEDKPAIFVGTTNENIDSVKTAWDFLSVKWADIQINYYNTSGGITELIMAVAKKLKLENDYKAFNGFLYYKIAEVDKVSPEFHKSLELLGSNIFWVRNYKDTIIDWTKRHMPNTIQCSSNDFNS